MAQSDIIAIAVPACEALAREMNYELVDVELAKEGPGKYLRIYIDKPGGITLDDCEAFHRAIQPKVERVDYDFLEVGSPGIAHAGKQVQVHLYRPVNRQKVFEGTLVGLVDGEIVLDTPQGQMHFAQKSASRVTPVLHFEDADFDADFDETEMETEGAGNDES